MGFVEGTWPWDLLNGQGHGICYEDKAMGFVMRTRPWDLLNGQGHGIC